MNKDSKSCGCSHLISTSVLNTRDQYSLWPVNIMNYPSLLKDVLKCLMKRYTYVLTLHDGISATKF